MNNNKTILNSNTINNTLKDIHDPVNFNKNFEINDNPNDHLSNLDLSSAAKDKNLTFISKEINNKLHNNNGINCTNNNTNISAQSHTNTMIYNPSILQYSEKKLQQSNKENKFNQSPNSKLRTHKREDSEFYLFNHQTIDNVSVEMKNNQNITNQTNVADNISGIQNNFANTKMNENVEYSISKIVLKDEKAISSSILEAQMRSGYLDQDNKMNNCYENARDRINPIMLRNPNGTNNVDSINSQDKKAFKSPININAENFSRNNDTLHPKMNINKSEKNNFTNYNHVSTNKNINNNNLDQDEFKHKTSTTPGMGINYRDDPNINYYKNNMHNFTNNQQGEKNHISSKDEISRNFNHNNH